MRSERSGPESSVDLDRVRQAVIGLMAAHDVYDILRIVAEKIGVLAAREVVELVTDVLVAEEEAALDVPEELAEREPQGLDLDGADAIKPLGDPWMASVGAVGERHLCEVFVGDGSAVH